MAMSLPVILQITDGLAVFPHLNHWLASASWGTRWLPVSTLYYWRYTRIVTKNYV